MNNQDLAKQILKIAKDLNLFDRLHENVEKGFDQQLKDQANDIGTFGDATHHPEVKSSVKRVLEALKKAKSEIENVKLYRDYDDGGMAAYLQHDGREHQFYSWKLEEAKETLDNILSLGNSYLQKPKQKVFENFMHLLMDDGDRSALFSKSSRNPGVIYLAKGSVKEVLNLKKTLNHIYDLLLDQY